MNHPHFPAVQYRCRPETYSLKPLLLLPAVGIILACTSCGESSPPKAAPPPVTDTRPVGEGLKVIGYAVLGAAVVGVLGRIIK